jgi:hypothetical protein
MFMSLVNVFDDLGINITNSKLVEVTQKLLDNLRTPQNVKKSLSSIFAQLELDLKDCDPEEVRRCMQILFKSRQNQNATKLSEVTKTYTYKTESGKDKTVIVNYKKNEKESKHELIDKFLKENPELVSSLPIKTLYEEYEGTGNKHVSFNYFYKIVKNVKKQLETEIEDWEVTIVNDDDDDEIATEGSLRENRVEIEDDDENDVVIEDNKTSLSEFLHANYPRIEGKMPLKPLLKQYKELYGIKINLADAENQLDSSYKVVNVSHKYYLRST